MVEQRIHKPQVAGSSPVSATIGGIMDTIICDRCCGKGVILGIHDYSNNKIIYFDPLRSKGVQVGDYVTCPKCMGSRMVNTYRQLPFPLPKEVLLW